MKSIIRLIKNNWYGNEKIWKIFWINYFIIGNLFSIFSYFLWCNFIFKNMVNDFNLNSKSFLSFIFILLNFIYITWVVISFWRAINNVKSSKLRLFYRILIITIISFNYTSILYKNNFKLNDNDLTINDYSEYWGAYRLPTENEWEKVLNGMTINDVSSIIEIKADIIKYENGEEIWKYYSVPINSEDDDILKALDGKTIFTIYFSHNKKVISKEINIFKNSL